MAIFYSRTEKNGKVLIQYNGLIAAFYYYILVIVVIIFLPLMALLGGSEDLAIKISNISDKIIFPLILLYIIYLIVFLLDSFKMWMELRKALKKGGVVVKGSKFSFKNPISYEYDKEK